VRGRPRSLGKPRQVAGGARELVQALPNPHENEGACTSSNYRAAVRGELVQARITVRLFEVSLRTSSDYRVAVCASLYKLAEVAGGFQELVQALPTVRLNFELVQAARGPSGSLTRVRSLNLRRWRGSGPR